MKKKLLAVLLTLSMALSLLPVSALAAWQANGKDITPTEITVEKGGKTYNGFTVDSSAYYTLAKLDEEGDVTAYYTYEGLTTGVLAGTLTWVDGESDTAVTVTFDPGEGAGTMEPAKLTAEQAAVYVAPACKFDAPAGYEFAGWLVDDAGEAVQPGDAIDLSGKTTVTLTAQWASAEGTVVETVTGSASNGKVSGSVEKVDGVDESTTTVVIEVTASASGANAAEVTLTKTAVATLKSAASLETVSIKASSVATVDLPKEVIGKLSGESKLTVDASAAVAGAENSTKISVSLSGAGEVKDLAAPIQVTLNIEVSASLVNPLVAYMKPGAPRPVRMWGGEIGSGKVSFKTRHLSDFAVMSAADTDPDTIDPQATGGARASVNFSIEPGATVQIAYELKNRGGETVVATIAGMANDADESGLAPVKSDISALAGGSAKVAGVYAVEGELAFSPESGWGFAPETLIAAYDVAEESE